MYQPDDSLVKKITMPSVNFEFVELVHMRL